MKKRAIHAGISLSLFFVFLGNAQQGDSPVLKGPYLGQKPPGMTPELFARGIVSTDRIEFGNTFSPDGREFYFTRFVGEKKLSTILFVKTANDRWVNPQVAPFSGNYSDVDPAFSRDGRQLYFSSNRPLKGAGGPKEDYDIWVVNRMESGWSEPVNPGFPVNSEKDDFAPSVAQNGAIYFASNREGGLGQTDFYCSRWMAEKYGEPENLGEKINTKYREGDGFVSADGNVFLFSAFVPGNLGSGDLYISFKGKDGKWTQARNLGSGINSAGNEFTPAATADGKYMFFASDRTGNDDIYWVDMRLVEKIAADHFIVQKPAWRKDVSCAPPRLFIMGGFKEKEIFSDVYRISVPEMRDGESAVWNREASIPKALQGHTAVVVSHHVFVMGGLEGFSETRRAVYSPDVFSVEIKETRLGEWKRIKPLPHSLGYHATVTYNDFIIISGGQAPADVSAVYKTSVMGNGKTGEWEKSGDLPKPMRGHAAVMVGDRLYIFGGHDDRGFFADVYSAPVGINGEIGRWECATPLPVPLVHFGVAEHKGRVYIFGGQDTEDNLHTEVYSAEVAGSKMGNWRRETPLPVPQSRMTVNVIDERVIVTGGGFGWAPPIYSAVFISEIGEGGVLGKWRKIGDLPKQLAFHAAVVCPEKQY